MSTVKEIYDAANLAIQAHGTLNSLASNALPEEVEKIVVRHARIAIATALIPIGGLDIAAATVNVWTMYISINKAIGLSFSENVMKSVGSAVISNIVQNVGFMAIVQVLKWNPFTFPISVAILAAALYGLTIVSGWVYLKALANMGQHDGDIEYSVRQSLSNYADIKELFEKYRKR